MSESGMRALVVKRVHEEAREIRAFDVLPEGSEDCHELAFAPGQVAVLEVEGKGRAYFAIASAPEDDELEFLVKLSRDPARRSIDETRPGDHLRPAQNAGPASDLAAP